MDAWNNATRTAFFRNAEQVGLSAAQRNALAIAGVVTPMDCLELYRKNNWRDVGDATRRAGVNHGTIMAQLG